MMPERFRPYFFQKLVYFVCFFLKKKLDPIEERKKIRIKLAKNIFLFNLKNIRIDGGKNKKKCNMYCVTLQKRQKYFFKFILAKKKKNNFFFF